jgi:hypothetical protein
MDENKYKTNCINNAVWYWQEKLKGTIFWWEVKQYSQEFIKEQIIFFKNKQTKWKKSHH